MKETSENKVVKVNDHLTNEPLMISKFTDKQSYTKNNMELINDHLNHNLRSQEDIITLDVKSAKTIEGGQEYITTSNSSEKRLLRPSLDRGGSFAPTPHGVAARNVNQNPQSILNKSKLGLGRKFSFL